MNGMLQMLNMGMCSAVTVGGVTYRKGDTDVMPETIKPAVINKVGRNEPCTCGSGRKYKKCCGR